MSDQLRMPEGLLQYAGAYQAVRRKRCKDLDALFLPLELLRHVELDTLHLSVSFSSTGIQDVYFSQKVSYIRAVRIPFKWLIIPGTASKLMTANEFSTQFAEFIDTRTVDCEEFWVIPTDHNAAVKARIREFTLDNSFRQVYQHDYFPDSA